MSDEEIARRALDFEARAQSYSLIDIPGYEDWASQKIEEGESPATITHLESIDLILLPEEVSTINMEIFEEMLDDLKFSLE